MDSLAKILSLKGQVWAESATGERRLLNVGDQLTVDESLKMDAGAQVDLDFGNNQLLTFLGEQQFNAEQSSEFFNENQSLLPLQSNADQTRLQVERQAEVTPSPQSPNVVSEGHGFLQLVRIGEIIEADGITPVTVAHIGEVLRPFGMALPLKELPKDEHKEYDYKREQPPRKLSEGMFIKLERGSGPKGIYNQLDTEDGKVSGSINFDPEIILPGDKITVTDKDGNPLLSSKGVPLLDYVLTPNDISQGFKVDVPVVEGQKTVELNVTIIDPDGNTATKSTNNSVDYSTEEDTPDDNETPEPTPPEVVDPEPNNPPVEDTTVPKATVELEPGSGSEGKYTDDDTQDGYVTGKVIFDPKTTEPGDTVKITDKDGKVIIERPITADDITNGIPVEIIVKSGQTEVKLNATVTDPAGNSSTGFDKNAIEPSPVAPTPTPPTPTPPAPTPTPPTNSKDPSVTVKLEDPSGPNGSYNADDVSDNKVSSTITFDPSTTKPGDKLTVTDKDGNPVKDSNNDPITDYVLTQDDIDNGITVDVPVTAGDTQVELNATLTNAEGKSSSDSDSKPIDDVTPKATVKLDDGTGTNGEYNGDDTKDGYVTGKVTFDSTVTNPGDTVKITDQDGKVIIERPITADDITNGIPVEIIVKPGQTEVELNATVTDPAGNSSDEAKDSKDIDNVTPTAVVELNPGTGTNDGYKESDLDTDGKVEGEITFDSNTTKPGDKITVTDKDGNPVLDAGGDPITDYALTQDDIDNGITVKVSVDTDGSEVELKVELTDPAGNSSTSQDSNPVDATPVNSSVTVELKDPSGPNGGYNKEDVKDNKVEGGITFDSNAKVGDKITVTDKNGNPVSATDGTTLTDYEITQNDIDNGISVDVPVANGDTEVELIVKVTDTENNESTVTDSKTVDDVAPQVTVELEGATGGAYKESDITDGKVSGKVTLGSTTVEVGDRVVVTGKDNTVLLNKVVTATDIANGISVEVPVSAGDTEIEINATVTDPAGNEGRGSVSTPILPVYVKISVDEEAVLEGGELTYKVELINEDGSTATAGKDQVINLNWSGAAGNDDIDGSLPTSITIESGASSNTFTVTTLDDAIPELSESLVVTINSVNGVSGTDKGFENPQIDASSNSATSNIIDKPTIKALDGNAAADSHITVYEKGLDDATDDSETATGTLRVSAPTGLVSVTIGGTDITLAQLQDLAATQPITIAGHGKLTIKSFAPTAQANGKDVQWDIGYSYELTDAQTHATGAGTNELLQNIDLKVTATPVDGIEITGDGNLGVLVIDDVPTIEITTDFDLEKIQVKESDIAGGNATATKNYAGAFTKAIGADKANEATSIQYALVVNAEASGLIDTQTNEPIKLKLEGDQVKGFVGDSTDLAFTIEVDSAGNVTLEQTRALKHSDPATTDDLVNIINGSISLKATITDDDGDTATNSVVIGDLFVFQDGGPTADLIAPGITIDEAHLFNGSNPDSSKTTSAKVSFTNVNFGADGVGDVQFTKGNDNATVERLRQEGLKSGEEDLEYVLSTDGHTLTAYRGADRAEASKIFTVQIVDATTNPSYQFTLNGPLDHLNKHGDKVSVLDLPFESILVTDGDGDSATTRFTVEVLNDNPSTDAKEIETNEDTDVTFNSNADATKTNTTIGTGDVDGDRAPKFGTVKIEDNGQLTYTPNDDYSGEDTFTYTTTTDSGEKTYTINMTVKPVADAPDIPHTSGTGNENVATANVETPEDTSVALGLKTPVITDATDQNGAGVTGDDPERLGAITLTVKDAPTGTELTKGDGTTTYKNTGVDGEYKFVITDVANLHLDGLTSGDATVNYVTQAEYEAIQAKPAEDRHENFKVEVSVDSYEVDASGAQISVDGNLAPSANSKQTINVDVKAVTDDVELKVKASTQTDVTVVVETDKKSATITFNEDDSINLTDILDPAAFKDTDGSEKRELVIEGLPKDAIVTVAGTKHTIGTNGKITIDDLPQTDGLPAITVQAPKDFSGDIKNIKVTLNAKDWDDDSSVTTNTETDSVTLNLYVNPIAGDVTAEDVTTEEDTAVAFMQGLKLTDDNTDGGNERITKVEFEVPTGWEVTAPTAAGDWTVNLSGTSYTITATNDSDLEDVLKDFEITPPAHSSKDETITVKVFTEDSNTVKGTKITDTQENDLAIKVTVTPVAERADSSTNDGSTAAADFDVKLNPNHIYDKSGAEDKPFGLGTDVGFKLSDGWSNEDGKWVKSVSWAENTDEGRSEDTFALLTPYGTKDNDAHPSAATTGKLEGSSFTYSDGATTHTLQFAGEPVKIPMQYLDSVTFTGPKDWSGIVKMQVQAGTVDYDEDTNAATDMAISGEAWLTNIIIEPRADQVTLKVDAIIKTLEDTPIDLNIIPTSSDATETFDVTISDIPEGAKITYKGIEYDTLAGTLPEGLNKEADGTYTLEIIDFDKTQKPTLTPPKDSNKTIELMVKAESVDSMTYINTDGDTITIEQKGDKVTYLKENGDTYKVAETITDIPELRQLPIEIQVQGVPDEPTVTIVADKEYFEDGAENHADQSSATGLKVTLSDLIADLKSGETGINNTGPDNSETITLRITDLPESFTLEGAGPKLGSGDGAGRLWVVSEADLANAKIVVPDHYSGTVKLTIQPVVTENDNPSESFFDEQNISFKVKPVTEAELSVSSDLVEDTVGQINLEPVLHGDTDEFISQVRIAVSDLPTGVTLYTDAAGSTLATVTGDYYVFNTAGGDNAPEVYVKGSANFSGNQIIKLEYTVTDPVGDGSAGITAATSTLTVDHTLSFTPVTDKIDLTLATGDITGGTSTAADSVITTQLTTAGSVKLNLKIDQLADSNSTGNGKDLDGSENLTHFVISGVPEGVSVKDAIETAKGQWLVQVLGKKWNDDSTLEQELEFAVSGYANSFDEQPITITSYSKDTGAISYEKDSVEWKLTYERTGDGDDVDLPVATLDAIAYEGTEDTSFTLDKVITGGVDSTEAGVDEYSVTVTVRTSPDDETTFTGMTGTQVIEEGVPVILWTQTVEVTASDDGQAKLEAMLAGITINLPEHSNSNDFGANGKLELDVNLSVHTHGISRDAQTKTDIEITPVTDDISIEVSQNSVDEGEAIALNITLPSKQTDGDLGDTDAGWTVVGDLVYIHIADGTLEGQLTDSAGNALAEYSGTNPVGTPAGGKVYAVDKDSLDGIKFVPDASKPYQTGKLDVTVLVEHQEANSGASKVSSNTGSLNIHISNSGYNATVSAEGSESDGTDDLIEVALTDDAALNDSAEAISAAFVSGLPSGFTIWTGSAGSEKMANNAGEGAWAIPVDGGLLPTMHIKPPKNWSGTLSNLNLTVLSGHTGLEPTPTDIKFDLVVNPVADGLDFNPTLSFGDAGEKIPLNLNVSMKDPELATGATGDQHTEFTTLEVTGLPDGEKALFYIGDSTTPLDDSKATFSDGTWTLTGLSQDDLNNLKFMHGDTAGVKDISVKAWTYEADASGQQIGASSAAVEKTGIKINVSSTVPTSGDDFFLWEDKSINGFGGEDTVQLRFGDNLTLTDFSKLENIETIDMAGYNSGENTITGLRIEDVISMTDENNILEILGDSEDKVTLDAGWTDTGSTAGGYVTYVQEGATLKIQDSIIID